jgi:hypothetical protein
MPRTKARTKAPTRARCGLCGKTGRLYKTPCCGSWICDDEDKYRLFSFATNSCSRNHRRYTVCGSHYEEEHEGDWRTCDECRDGYPKLEMYVYAATNEFNFTKLENPPAYEPTRCAKCQEVIHLGSESYSVKGDDYLCAACSPRIFVGAGA